MSTQDQEVYKNTDDIYKSFQSLNFFNANIYKQHDATTGKVLHCGVPQKSPMEIAISEKYTQANAPTFEAYKTVATGNCDNTKYSDTNKYPEIEKYLKREYEIFTKLYINPLSVGQNSSNLVPVLDTDNKTMTCPSGYIPYVLEHHLAFQHLKYDRFCIKPTGLKNINFSSIGDYKAFRVVEKNTDLPCGTNVCHTKHAPFLGHNLESQPVVSNTSEKNSNHNVDIIAGVCTGVLLLIILGVILYYRYGAKKIEKRN